MLFNILFPALFVVTILATNLILNLVSKKDVQIPNLVGKEQSKAKKILNVEIL